MTNTWIFLAASVALAACNDKAKPPAATAEPSARVTQSAPKSAALGKPAPDFELSSLDGKRVRLSAYKGKIVVLEWFNPECPFVRLSHTKGSLVGTAERHAKQGVVWLAINSGAPGKQGHGLETNREAAASYRLQHPVLLDEAGKVGRSYAAERTPHMFVIDAQGILRYRGAIDNSPDGEGQSPQGGPLLNYVDAAVEDLRAGRPVRASETHSYGCSIKYAG
jgi:peroxiredoxin